MSALPVDRSPPAGATGGRVAAAPLELPRLVMRRALWVALCSLLLAIGLGVAGARHDTGQELEGALNLARANELLALSEEMAEPSDELLLQRLGSIGGLRHLRLEIDRLSPGGPARRLFASDEPPPPSPVLAAMLSLNRRFATAAVPAPVSWRLDRPDGTAWRVTFSATPQSEQREAMSNLLALFGLLALCCASMLLVMQVNVRRAFRPLQPMLRAIARVEQQDLAALQALPAMPIRELDAIAAALRHLADSLQQADAARRVLAQQVLTLQEDERQRLARDLHDEFGQRLTALRVDAAWLRKRLTGQPDLEAVVDGMSAQCALIQQDVRGLLARLHPLGEGRDAAPLERWQRLEDLLRELVSGWAGGPAAPRHQVALACERDDGEAGAALPSLPRELVLAVYRITQEALTNVARHANASRAEVRVRLRAGGGVLDWSVQDDGGGVADVAAAFRQGNGLAGIKERVWALGGEFDAGPASGPPPHGWRLQARLPVQSGDGPENRHSEEAS